MMLRCLIFCACLAVFFVNKPQFVFGQASGKEVYQLRGCDSCHGEKAGGIKKLKAPPLAGQDATYLKRQLTNFKYGARGFSKEDISGKVMANIAKNISDQEIQTLSTYLNSLEPVNNKPSLAGNPQKGAQSFLVCSACHSPQGIGNPVLNAPNLMILDDWYIKEQLYKFQRGLRGIAEKDLIGATMAPNSLILSDDAMIRDVASYIHSLRNVDWEEAKDAQN